MSTPQTQPYSQSLSRYVLKIIGTCLAIYLCLTAALIAQDHWRNKSHSKIQSVDYYEFFNNWRFFSYSYDAITYGLHLMEPQDQMVMILGASNTGFGFDAHQMAEELPGYAVYDLSMPGANIGMLGALFDDLNRQFDVAQYKDVHIIIGIYFALFQSDEVFFKTRGGTSQYTHARLRHHAYREEEDGAITPQFKNLLLQYHFQTHALRPFSALYGLDRHIFFALRENDLASALKASEADRIREKMHDRLTRFEASGQFSAKSFEALGDMALQLRSMGLNVHVVDMPIVADYRAHGADMLKTYDGYLTKLEARLGQNIISLRHLGDPAYYRDDVHPTAEGTQIWTKALTKQIF